MEQPRRILVVDDTAIFHDVERRFLASSGSVVAAHSGAQALDLARRERPAIVITDITLPGLNGDSLCAALKADPALAGVPVVVITSADAPQERERAVRAGADDVLAKPIDRVSLIQAVSRFLDGPDVRHQARVSIDASVAIRHRGETFEAAAVNISRGGLFVHTSRPAEVGEEIDIEIRMPETGDVVTATARVRWRRPRATGSDQTPAGIGVQFLAMDGRSSRLVEDFVYERTPSRAA